MINEQFLQSAVNIRRKYLKVINNMDLYQKRANEIVQILEKSISDLEKLQKDVSSNKSTSAEIAINKLLEVIKTVEDEGNRLEKLVEPINDEIEKLSKEENTLYLAIKDKYPQLSDDEIVKQVSERLNREGI
jgi:DNA repair ATPase RecN